MSIPLSQKNRRILCVLLFTFTILTISKLILSYYHPNYDQSFEAFTDELFRQELSTNTISLHYTLESPETYELTNLPVTYGKIPSSPEEACASTETVLQSLKAFEDVPLSKDNKLTYDILRRYLELGLKGSSYLFFEEPLSAVSGIHTELPILLAEFPFNDKEDVNVYLRLLEQTDLYFDMILDFEYKKIEHGTFMPDYQVDEIISYCNAFLSLNSSNPLIHTFTEKLKPLHLPSSEHEKYLSQNINALNNHVYPAYKLLITTLQNWKGTGSNEMGLYYYPDGKEYFSYLLESEIGIAKPVKELQEMTYEQISEDLFAMEQAAGASSAPTDCTSLIPSEPDLILKDLKQNTASQFPNAPTVNLEIKFVSSAMEEYLSPAFYMIPAIDNTKENVIYINRGQTLDGINLYTTLAHEGYPGHLYQTVYFSSQNPDPIRNILYFGGYVEGWATYAEMMSYYLAPISKANAILLQKNASIILGLYALADMGIHYDGWTLEETISFFSDYGISDPATVQEIYHLIIGAPANYAKYYLGYLTIYNLKKEAANVLGNKFSQCDFHKAILDVGPAPFDIVEEYVREQLY